MTSDSLRLLASNPSNPSPDFLDDASARSAPVERVVLVPSLKHLLHSTSEHEDVVAMLLDAEHSRRVLLLRAVIGLAKSADVDTDVESLSEAWSLLEAADARDRGVVRRVLLAPSAGLWVARLIRRLRRGGSDDAPPLWVETGYLSQIAAAAAAIAGLDFSIAVPVRDGDLFLPCLGTALVSSDGPWASALVTSEQGRLRIESGGASIEVPTDDGGEGWLGVHRLHVSHTGLSLTVDIEDLAPYSLVPTGGSVRRLSAQDVASWQGWLDEAWGLLVRDHPDSARALSSGLLALTPLERGLRLRPRSASSSDAFGCVLLSAPDLDSEVLAANLAATLIHEFRHTILNGLISLLPLFDDDQGLYRAPWRDDPRPVGGIVHGAFAFAGVARFWKTRAALDSGTAGRLARFEYELWRSEVRGILGVLEGCDALTEEGRALVDALKAEIKPWVSELATDLDLEAREAAEVASTYHRIAWAAHHVRPDEYLVKELTAKWRAGEGLRDLPVSHATTVTADPDACRLDVVALLTRLRIVAPAEFDALVRDPASVGSFVSGATVADVALVSGELDAAAALYLAEVRAEPTRLAALAGLALSSVGRDKEAAEALAEHPELVAAVRGALGSSSQPDPLALASWLSGGQSGIGSMSQSDR